MTSRWPAESPVLSDGVVTLRGLVRDDVDAVFAACQDPEIPRFTSVPSRYLREHAESFVNDLGAGVGRGEPSHMATLTREHLH
ncbi:unannotated protein [freshwater metagenome]|uniref:Unannotated protein n=1 Tax=freshwater metagenome TaxID=449393 RepID=A0A6J7IDH6_9ZZZZ